MKAVSLERIHYIAFNYKINWEVKVAKTCEINNEIEPTLTRRTSVHLWHIEPTGLCRNQARS